MAFFTRFLYFQTVGRVLKLEDMDSIKRSVFEYIGPPGEPGDIETCPILRQYDGCKFPAMISEAEQLMTEKSVCVKFDFVDGQDCLLFSTD